MIGYGFSTYHDALAGNPLGRGTAVFLDRQKKMDLKFGHRLDVRIDAAVHPG